MVGVLLTIGTLARAGDGGAGGLWEYTDAKGIVHAVQELDSVPPAYRAKAKQIGYVKGDLNEQLGNEIERRTDDDYDALQAQRAKEAEETAAKTGAAADDTCPKASPATPALPLWRSLWARYPVLIVAFAMCLALLVATPAMYRRMAPENWNKVLMRALPLFVFLGFIGHSAHAASHGARTFKAIMAGRVCPDP